MLVLIALSAEVLRFAQLRNRIGDISEKMLAQNLRDLVRNGLADRVVESTTPPKVYYSLTPLGRELAPRLRDLMDWSAARGDEIAAAQGRYDAQREA